MNPATARPVPDDITDHRILITGANSGIGWQAALALVRAGAVVILACRDRSRGEAALARLRVAAPRGRAELRLLDLASLDSVRRFAADELQRGLPLQTLINNAGVMAPPRRLETEDGFELQLGTNLFGHFALTTLLMPALELAVAMTHAAPRIVTVASIAHKRGRIDFDDLQSTRDYSPSRSYAQSKLADLMFAFELDRRLRAAGSRVLSVAAHPGVAQTNLFRAGERSAVGVALRSVVTRAIGLLLNTEADGALPTVYAATSPAVEGGGYYGPTGFMEARGRHVGRAQVAPQARDAAAAQRLWRICEQLTTTRLS
jgi:NAD(P)-dependent dehydrogenase (short-subunit alcohol dehydrogenase family)